MVQHSFPGLSSPFRIKDIVIRNRVVVSGHHAGWWVDEGRPSAEFAAYIEERARGGVGLFVIGCTSPERGSGWLENVDDTVIPSYRMCVDAAHAHGCKLFAQLCHPGFHPLPGTPITAPPPKAKAIQPAYSEPKRHVPSAEELQRLVRSFGQAAVRCVQGEVDGVELHSHESFLHAQMLNPLWNQRDDQYGGSLENRMRFMVETLTEMRRGIGDRMILGLRLKVDDMLQTGMDLEEYAEATRRLDGLGIIDYINFTCGDGPLHHGPMPRAEGEWLPRIRQIRSATKLPLMHAGHITTPEMAEDAIAGGVTDFVVMTKAHIADPHFTRKIFDNRLEDIRYCTRCLQSCLGALHRMTCVYNPVTSRESSWATLEPATQVKRVVIVGAGPAGMEAAVTAAERGHNVVVLERKSRVGGQIWAGAASPMRRNWARIAEFYERQSRKGTFETLLNYEATIESVLAFNPDAVVIATGSQPNRLQIPGARTWTVMEAVSGALDDAPQAIVYDGEGFNRPMVAADYLSAKGVGIDFVTPFLEVGPTIMGEMRDELTTQLASRGVRFWPGHEIADCEREGSVMLRSVQTAEETILPRATTAVPVIVAAVGSSPVADLAKSLRKLVPELYVIGDANVPQTVEAATYQGGRVGRLL